MKLSHTFIVVALAGSLGLGACRKEEEHQPSEAEVLGAKIEVPTATVEQVSGWLAAGQATAVDANQIGTRVRSGTVPGAILLTDYETYPMTELPADKAKKLVFYCANESCGASHQAAARAVDAGYKDVLVMPAGIAGWVKAGQKVKPLS